MGKVWASNNTDVELRKPPTHDTKEETLWVTMNRGNVILTERSS